MKYTFIFFACIWYNGCAQLLHNSLSAQDKPIAFPEAEGFGKYATGGRGGKVYVVTNLNDSGEGSLREAIKKHGPRIITFAISGTISLESELVINNDSITIAGQSAPGDGICIRNFPFRLSANNIIIRYMRFRMGDEKNIQGDSFSGTKLKHVIIDHCSISWATDECASFYNNENFTMQWCIISESLNSSIHKKGNHGYGGIWGGKNASFHHNLIAHHSSRLPRFSGSATTRNDVDEMVDFRNNVIYNWGQNNIYGGEKGKYNVVNNYFKPGPATPKSKRSRIINPSQPYGAFYLQGNFLVGNETVSKVNAEGIVAEFPDSTLSNSEFEVGSIKTFPVLDAYEQVLRFAGASFRRDAIDVRIVTEVQKGSATFGVNRSGIIDSQKEVGGWPVLATKKAQLDSDADGMPDQWENRKGLNLNDPSDAAKTTLHPFYTNVEIFLAEPTRD